jgi:hypothetical protein
MDQLDVGQADGGVRDPMVASVNSFICLSQSPRLDGARSDIQEPESVLAGLNPERHRDIEAIADEFSEKLPSV